MSMKRVLVVIGVCLLCLLGIVAVRYAYVKAKYPVILKDIESKRAELLKSKSYRQAKSEEERSGSLTKQEGSSTKCFREKFCLHGMEHHGRLTATRDFRSRGELPAVPLSKMS